MLNSVDTVPQSGLILVNKQAGVSSFGLVKQFKFWLRHHGVSKVGHAGTLDEKANGLMIIAFGEATKVLPYGIDLGKEYEFVVQWGQETPSFDLGTEVVKVDSRVPTLAEVELAASQFVGVVEQMPPLYSAVKVQGKRASDWARESKSVSLSSRSVTIESLVVLSHLEGEGQTVFKVVCSKGTYVRSLVRDMAVYLGYLATTRSIYRTKVGKFSIEDAFFVEKGENLLHNKGVYSAIYSVYHFLRVIFSPEHFLDLTSSEANHLVQGRTIRLLNTCHTDKTPVFGVLPSGEVLAIGYRKDDLFSPFRILNI